MERKTLLFTTSLALSIMLSGCQNSDIPIETTNTETTTTIVSTTQISTETTQTTVLTTELTTPQGTTIDNSQSSHTTQEPPQPTTTESTTLKEHSLAQAALETFQYYFGKDKDRFALYFNILEDDTNYTPIVSSKKEFRSASVIKLFILLALYDQYHANKIIKDDFVPLKNLAEAMISTSDNTATNQLIETLGGKDEINRIIKTYGFYDTSLNRIMLDYDALEQGIDNYVSADDLGEYMTRLATGTLFNKKIDREILTILSDNSHETKTNYLAMGLPVNIDYYNKTGQFPDYGVLTEAILVETEDFSYVIVVLANDEHYQENITKFREFSNDIYRLVESNQ